MLQSSSGRLGPVFEPEMAQMTVPQLASGKRQLEIQVQFNYRKSDQKFCTYKDIFVLHLWPCSASSLHDSSAQLAVSFTHGGFQTPPILVQHSAIIPPHYSRKKMLVFIYQASSFRRFSRACGL